MQTVRNIIVTQIVNNPDYDIDTQTELIAEALDPSIDPSDVPPGTLEVSVLEDQGVEELQELMTRLAGDEGQRLASEHKPELAGSGDER